jgi:hypothetical protein
MKRCVAAPPGVVCQDEGGRLWGVLWMLAPPARRGPGAEVRFGVYVRIDKRERTPPLVRLKAMCGPGDDGEPIVTVMLPDEAGVGGVALDRGGSMPTRRSSPP